MVRDIAVSPIRLQDIEAMEAHGVRREIVDGQWRPMTEDHMARIPADNSGEQG